jgi:hypothetical protein
VAGMLLDVAEQKLVDPLSSPGMYTASKRETSSTCDVCNELVSAAIASAAGIVNVQPILPMLSKSQKPRSCMRDQACSSMCAKMQMYGRSGTSGRLP